MATDRMVELNLKVVRGLSGIRGLESSGCGAASAVALETRSLFETQSHDPIGCYGKPVERTNEIGIEMISLASPLVSNSDLIGSHDWVRN